ncbi:asparagine synthase [Candidatus Scalindua japonica]|uniref:asparagine synthase (glutamine-hydrolyzing) n=1 Tax=Candidatus Scalindua japonica TaxID=1284222 RepID=A0A286U4B0_9BACT|nr:asparagine synthase C-terminal domain-containing protein [Candidatus Scalindua japonica]GAX62988.1 asparagine synthase [Candidatus Scalindua japonica]
MAVFNEEEKSALFLPEIYHGINNHSFHTYEAFYEKCAADNYLEKALYLDEKIYLPDDLLMKADKMTMANSLEARSPFLDHKLVEFVAQLPHEYKLRGKTGKYILKQTVKDIIPEEIVYRRKHGFNVPVQTWLSGWLREYARELLSEQFIRQQGIFNPDYVQFAWRLMEKKAYNYDRRVWLILMFQIWYCIFIDKSINVRTESM